MWKNKKQTQTIAPERVPFLYPKSEGNANDRKNSYGSNRRTDESGNRRNDSFSGCTMHDGNIPEPSLPSRERELKWAEIYMEETLAKRNTKGQKNTSPKNPHKCIKILRKFRNPF